MSEPDAKRSPRETFTLLDLALENIGPFDRAELTFYDLDEPEPQVPVTILTGENGAGKSIVIDAIRGMFGPHYATLERPVWRPTGEHSVRGRFAVAGATLELAVRHTEGAHFGMDGAGYGALHSVPHEVQDGRTSVPWVVDFWRSTLATDSYAVPAFSPPVARQYLVHSLQGTYRNADVTQLLVYFDYLRDSRDMAERRAGEVLYTKAREIVALSLLDGELLEVQRSTFTPMVRQGGQTVPLASLSSGNAYMIQHMIRMLGKMHAVCMIRGEEPERMCEAPGLLLLDEAENHLHPRWQKRFLGDIRRLFPNLQIIATTHSPFVIGSVPGARVYVCRYVKEDRVSVIEDATASYANKPVDDILLSPAFEGTEPFGIEITALLERRRRAIEARDTGAQHEAEKELYARNPTYFGYLRLGEQLREAGE